MIASRSFCTISPCIDETVKLDARIFSVSQSTYSVMECWTRTCELITIQAYLSTGVTEDDSLSDCECVVQIAERVELPVFLLHSYEELLNAFQRQLVTLDENSDGIGHELRCHLQDIIWQSGAQKDNLCCGGKVPVHIIYLILEALVQ